ncbi:MAG: DUF3109 family protein [Candidatus Riflebacteria bacterium]|nr:DUF3109 family protein [Candidatus Riflebacteria bacterium]
MHIIENVLISDEVWDTNFQCDLENCKGDCCRIGDLGAPIFPEEEEKICANFPKFANFLSSKIRNFLSTGISETYKGKLVIREISPNFPCPLSFKNESGIILCSLHAHCLESNIFFMNLKPIWCSLFPLIISNNDSSISINIAIQPHCKPKRPSQPVLAAFSKELSFIFGDKWVATMLEELGKH